MITHVRYCRGCAQETITTRNKRCGFCSGHTEPSDTERRESAARYSVARAALCASMAASDSGITKETPA